jgi:hypothetical protein
MTATLEGVVPYYDEEGNRLLPGTLCWIATTNAAPLNWRNKQRVLSVFIGSTQHNFMLLLPKADDPFDEDPTHAGWPIEQHLTDEQIEDLGLYPFVETHNGWWPGSTMFRERALGFWCVQHQVFHAASTCPLPDQPRPVDHVEFDWAAKVLRLERELVQARADVEQARVQGEQNLEDFKVRCSDILGSEANSHDLCGEYDRIAEDAGLYPRMQDQEVEIEVTYRQTVTIRARSWDAAQEEVKAKSATSFFAPPTVFADQSNIEDQGTPYSLSFTIAD